MNLSTFLYAKNLPSALLDSMALGWDMQYIRISIPLCRSRETENLEYLKNIIIHYMSADSAGRDQMINPIATVLHFSKEEVSMHVYLTLFTIITLGIKVTFICGHKILVNVGSILLAIWQVSFF